jgi:hypothetical protein
VYQLIQLWAYQPVELELKVLNVTANSLLIAGVSEIRFEAAETVFKSVVPIV